jgi:hypothetical protein
VLLVVAVLVGGQVVPRDGTTRIVVNAGTDPVAPGNLVVFATDGGRLDTPTSVVRRAAPEEIARQLLARGDKCTDNALVVAVRFWGGES